MVREAGASPEVRDHVEAVAVLAVALANEAGEAVNVSLVEAGALLHDVGRTITQGPDHVIQGARLLRDLDVDEVIVRIVERHMGAGITEQEALQLSWPMDRSYVPITLEERIVAHADNLTHGTRWVTVDATVEKFKQRGLPLAASRVRALHDLVQLAIGKDPNEVVQALQTRHAPGPGGAPGSRASP